MCRLTFSLFLCISPLIAIFATQWPGASVAEKAELLDAAFPSEALVTVAKACEAKAEERAAQVEEAKRNALQPFPPHAAPNHSAELQRTAKAKAAAQFYTRMREQYKAEGILQEYVSPFADCAADCAQLMQNLANAHNELSILRDGEQEQKQLQKQHKGNKQFRENLLVEADMELGALAAALGSAQLALQRLEERHERNTEWLMPSTFECTLKTLSKFSLHNAMAEEKEKRKKFNNSSSNSESGDEAAKAETTESGEQWENIPLK